MSGIQRVCHQLRTAGYAEERCEKSELASSVLIHFRMSAGKAWFLVEPRLCLSSTDTIHSKFSLQNQFFGFRIEE